MSALIFLVLFALAENIDNLLLAGAYGLRNVIIPLRANLTIATLSGVATGAGVMSARLSQLEAVHFSLASLSEVVGRGMLIMIGVWALVAHFRAKLFPDLDARLPHPNKPRDDHSGSANNDRTVMCVSAAMLPGTALAVDNIAPSFAFGLVNPKPDSIVATGFILAALTAALSVTAVWIGQATGKRGIDHLLWISPTMASGCLMIAIALLDPGALAQAWIKP
jgi:putative Mn2+ efflux pump MntP